MSGIHTIEITYDDGRTERRECPCLWCDVWRAVMTPEALARLDAATAVPVWPQWLGPQPSMPETGLSMPLAAEQGSEVGRDELDGLDGSEGLSGDQRREDIA